MSDHARVFVGVGLAAAAAAAVVVIGVIATDGGRGGAKTTRAAPPLALDLAGRTDPEARALARAAVLYDRGKRRRAARIFDRYGSLEAQVGAAFSAWPSGTLDRLRALARTHPRSALVQLHLGIARSWVGRATAARRAWRAAKSAQPDTSYALRADGLLHPNYAPGAPTFVPEFAPPASLARVPAARRLAVVRAAAARGGVRAKLIYGVLLQQLGHQLSAERAYAGAARLAPRDPEAQVAAAVGLFDKDHPERAFARLGPLARRFPRSASVRFHLGLLLAWIGQVRAAERELKLAVAVAPSSPLAREAQTFVTRLESIRTK